MWVLNDKSKSLRATRAEFFKRLAPEHALDGAESGDQVLHLANDATWRHVWLLYATSIVLAIALGLCAYQVGVRRALTLASRTGEEASRSGLEQRMSDVAHEYEMARVQLGSVTGWSPTSAAT